jgi:hypothetical protein
MVGGHPVPEVHQLGGGLEAQGDAPQTGHVGVPGAETGVLGDEGAAGTEASSQPVADGRRSELTGDDKKPGDSNLSF